MVDDPLNNPEIKKKIQDYKRNEFNRHLDGVARLWNIITFALAKIILQYIFDVPPNLANWIAFFTAVIVSVLITLIKWDHGKKSDNAQKTDKTDDKKDMNSLLLGGDAPDDVNK